MIEEQPYLLSQLSDEANLKGQWKEVIQSAAQALHQSAASVLAANSDSHTSLAQTSQGKLAKAANKRQHKSVSMTHEGYDEEADN